MLALIFVGGILSFVACGVTAFALDRAKLRSQLAGYWAAESEAMFKAGAQWRARDKHIMAESSDRLGLKQRRKAEAIAATPWWLMGQVLRDHSNAVALKYHVERIS